MEGVDLLTVDHSNTFVACGAKIIDNRTSYTGDLIDYKTTKGIQALSGQYQTIARLVVPAYRGARVSVMVEGVLQGVDTAVRSYRFLLAREGGNVQVVPMENAAFGAPLDINVDTASSPGSAILQVRSPAAAGGSEFDGSATVEVDGRLAGIYPQ